VEDGQPGGPSGGGDQEVRDGHAPVRQSGLNLNRPLDPRFANLRPREAAAIREDGQVVGAASSAEEQLQVNDAAGGYLTC
jgi:hypothetical protein